MKLKSAICMMIVALSLVSFTQQVLAANPVVGSVDTCFSPAERCDLKLISLLGTASKTLDIAIYSITHPQIVAAIIAAKNRGVLVRMVVDRQQSSGASSLVNQLKGAGVPLRIGNVQGIMHDKYSIVDLRTIEAGSFNYTMNATQSNAENQLYLNDPTTVAKYEANFVALWNSSAGN